MKAGNGMKTKYKYIHFEQMTDSRWECLNNQTGFLLCLLEYYDRWRQWEMCEVNPDAGFTADCLADIQHFMGQLSAPQAVLL